MSKENPDEEKDLRGKNAMENDGVIAEEQGAAAEAEDRVTEEGQAAEAVAVSSRITAAAARILLISLPMIRLSST